MGPDVNGRYGGSQGVGGLEATVRESDGLTTPVLNDYFGNVLATISGGNVSWNPVRVGGYGPVLGYRASPLTLSTPLADTLAWRSRTIDLSGFYYLGCRYYDPVAGHFLAPDPLGHAASMDLYGFCNGDPLNSFDADGRFGKNIYKTAEEIIAAPFTALQNASTTLGGASPWNLLNPLSRQFLPYDLSRGALTSARLAEGLPFSILSGDIFHDQELNPGASSAYINGIFTPDQARNNTIKLIINQTGWSGTVGIRNSTFLYIGDILQILGEELGAITISSIFAAEQITDADDGGRINVVAHSQGTSVFRGAVALLDDQTRADVNYQGFGSESFINGNLYGLGGARNVYNPGDPVPYLSPFDYLRTFLAQTFVPFADPEVLSAQNKCSIGFSYHNMDVYYVKSIHP
jgi:RHS repeat-associated protein